ncbi:major facilitator superfamily domain-containing protein [Multifurca ochricompacta]|uniref:Lysosomal dipeptide transporter MFSD1 n=1 Tax=Multifurca ochricompacta TaxID=376703 RepID=A0AAD4QRR5_9AGAM|nr:major facilitator superfamily domain-containing protein [Multifurca ochricompacta]
MMLEAVPRSQLDNTYEVEVPDQEEAAALLAPADSAEGSPQHQHSALRILGIRAIALLCACSLSIGSHYGSYILAPLKSRLERELGTSDVEFSLLVSAFSLNSTWTPLLGGVLTSRLGTTVSSVLATGVILIGLSILLVGDLMEDVKLMTVGMFVFGLGISPLSVAQETIIVKFFRSQGLGVPMALGLVVGKASAYISAHTSYPLSERFGTRAPFYVAVALAAMSFGLNLLYASIARWLASETGAELETPVIRTVTDPRFSGSPQNVVDMQAKGVNLYHVVGLGDAFWAYIGANFLCGAVWNPFPHLASNILEHRFNLTEQEASYQASFLLAGSIVLYPLVGFVIDKLRRPYLVLLLLCSSSLLTLIAYVWLVLPPDTTGTAWPATACFATGIGYSSLLLVVLVPQLVPTKYISTALGAHKSLEQTGTVISQTLAGFILDKDVIKPDTPPGLRDGRSQLLLNAFLGVNAFQLGWILLLWHLIRQRDGRTRWWQGPQSLHSIPDALHATKMIEDDDDGEGPLLLEQLQSGSSVSNNATLSPSDTEPLHNPNNFGIPLPVGKLSIRKKGIFFGGLCIILVVIAWALFLITAWLRLRSKSERVIVGN